MRKLLATLSLIGFLSQPVFAQVTELRTYVPSVGATEQMPHITVPRITGGGATINPETRTNFPTGRAVQAQMPCAPCPTITGGAAVINPEIPVPPTEQVVNIRRPFLLNRTGFTPLCPSTCGACPTGGASTVGPVMRPVYIPKERWWERNQVKMMPVYPTGGAACSSPTPCGCTPAPQPTTPPVIQRPPVKTGGAAHPKKPVRGKW